MQETARESRRGFWLGIIISLASLAAIFIFVKPSEIVSAVENADYNYLLATALTLVLFLLFRAVRWRFLLHGGWRSREKLPYSSVFHIQNIGYMLSNLLPFRIGDVARAVLIGNVPPMTIPRGISTMVVERVMDLLLIVILFPFTVANIGDLPDRVRAVVLSAGFLAVGAGIALFLMANFRKPAVNIAERLLQRIRPASADSWTTRFDDLLAGLDTLTRVQDGMTLIFLSILVWVPIVAGYYLGLKAVRLEPSLTQAAFVVCIAAFSVTAPSSPGQVGVFEASVTFAIATILGMSEGKAAGFAFLYHATNYIVFGLLGAIGIARTGSTMSQVIASTRTFMRAQSEKPLS